MDGWITIGTELETKNFEREYKRLIKRVLEIGKEQIDIELAIRNGQKTQAELDALRKRSADLNNELEEIQLKIGSLTYGRALQQMDNSSGQLDKNFKSVNNTLAKSVKNISKMLWGILGAAGAFSLLKTASSELASYDKQYAANLEYIRYVLTQAVAPILRYIVNLAGTLLQYLNLMLQSWFGINLFSNASAENFAKMKARASGASKAVKEIKKQLLGFDEINMLTDKSDTGTKVGMPSFDINNLQGEVPDWMKWILENGDKAKVILEGMGAALLSLKLGLNGRQGVGLLLVIDGIIKLIQHIEDFTKNPTVAKFGEILQDIGQIILGIAAILGSIPLAVLGQIVITIGGAVQWIQALLDFIKEPSWEKYVETIRTGIKSMGILGLAIDWIVENVAGGWDNITNILKTVGDWIYNNVIKPVVEFFQGLWNKISEIFAPVIEFFKNIFNTVWENIQIIGENIHQVFSVLWDNIKQIFEPVAEWFKGIFKSAYEAVTKVFEPIGNFFEGIWNTIKSKFKDIGQKIGEIVGGAFKNAINAVLSTIENILNTPIRAINELTDIANLIPGINLRKLNTFNLPRLKSGAILNVPNKGTLVSGGNAIAGEAGHEGYIPLTDQQAMSQLGREIGRNVLINLTNITTMNGRVLSREIKQVQSEQDFAYNT